MLKLDITASILKLPKEDDEHEWLLNNVDGIPTLFWTDINDIYGTSNNFNQIDSMYYSVTDFLSNEKIRIPKAFSDFAQLIPRSADTNDLWE